MLGNDEKRLGTIVVIMNPERSNFTMSEFTETWVVDCDKVQHSSTGIHGGDLMNRLVEVDVTRKAMDAALALDGFWRDDDFKHQRNWYFVDKDESLTRVVHAFFNSMHSVAGWFKDCDSKDKDLGSIRLIGFGETVPSGTKVYNVSYTEEIMNLQNKFF